MTQLKNSIPSRQSESFKDRLHYCTRLLYVHGFATESEAKRIHARIGTREKKESKGNTHENTN
jgi:hypothetical protein